MGGTVEDFLAFLLGDAAQEGNDLVLSRILQVLEAVEDLLLRFVADAAGVVEDVVGSFGGLDLRVAGIDQRADYLFGVMCVHLAPEGLDVEGFFHGNSIVAGTGGAPDEGFRVAMMETRSHALNQWRLSSRSLGEI